MFALDYGFNPAGHGVRLVDVLPVHFDTQLVPPWFVAAFVSADVQFDGIARLEARGETTIDLTLQARHAGDGRLQTVVQCDQMSQPLQRDEATSIVAAP